MKSLEIRWKKLIKAIGPLLLLVFLIKVIDPWEVVDHLRGINIGIFLSNFLLFPFVISVRTFRWWIICRSLNIKTSFRSLFPIYYVSRFLSLLPVTGVFALSRIIYLKEEGKPVATAAISIIIDKLADILGLIFFSLFAVFFLPQYLIEGIPIWILYVTGILLISAFFVFSKRLRKGVRRILERYMNQKFSRIGADLETSLARFWSDTSLKFIMLILVIGLAVGLLRSLILYVLALSINIHVPFAMIVGCRALIGIVNIIPVSIGGLGTRDAVLLLVLPLSGVSSEAAVVLGFIAFLWNILLNLSGMIFWFNRPLPTEAIASIKDRLFS
jgi:uncharacterized protein (TIRG00374 family)